MKFTIISSSGSYPITTNTSNYDSVFVEFSVVDKPGPVPGNTLPGSSSSYSSSSTSCTNIISQISYVITTFTPTVGQFLYDNSYPSPGTPINGGNNWISVWGGYLQDYRLPTNKYSLRVSPTGQILNVVFC